MTKEQIATARQLASDMGFEPSHPEMNRVGEIMDRLLDEREALLEAVKAAQCGGEAGHWEESGCPVCRSAERDGVGGHDAGCSLASALAKAEAE